jgi:AGCS family alanine or glycine:cation symporter
VIAFTSLIIFAPKTFRFIEEMPMWTINLLSACLTVIAGFILLSNLRFFFILHPVRFFRSLTNIFSYRDTRRSLFLALAGTLGVGNIYGVSLGIILGGEGSVLWLFVSSIFAMAVKYSECVVATESASFGRGMMIPIKKSFGSFGGPIAKAYCLCMLVLSLSMGALIQSDSLITSAVYIFPADKMAVAAIFLLAVIIVVSGGGGKIKNATEALIPLATIFYVILCLFVIIKDSSRLPSVFSRIFFSAFSLRPFLGGTLPVISFSAFSQGFARGLLSNEAGVGTSAMAHSESRSEPHDAGLAGITEILFDTNLLCMLTALVILIESDNPSSAESPMALVFCAFRRGAGQWSEIPLFISIILFAYSTVICWYYYGVRCLSYLGIENKRAIYCFFFSLAILLPVFLRNIVAVYLSDILLFLMSVPTLICLILNRNMVSEAACRSGIFKK